MKQPDREWLEQYRTNPRGDSTVYKNVQNPNQWQLPGLRDAAMQAGRQQMEQADAQTLQQLVGSLPAHVRNLSAEDMLDYIRQSHMGQQNLEQERTRYDTNIAQRRTQMEQQNQQRLERQRAQQIAAQQQGAQEMERRASEQRAANALIQAQLQEAQRQAQLRSQQQVPQQAQQAEANRRADGQRANDEYYANLNRQRAWNYYDWARNNALFYHIPEHRQILVGPHTYGLNSTDSRNQAGIFLEDLARQMGITPDAARSLNPEQFGQFYDKGMYSTGLREGNWSEAASMPTFYFSQTRAGKIPDWKYTTYGTRHW